MKRWKNYKYNKANASELIYTYHLPLPWYWRNIEPRISLCKSCSKLVELPIPFDNLVVALIICSYY